MNYGKVAFIGGGNMARALAGGMYVAGYNPSNILIADPLIETRDRLANEFPGTIIRADNLDVAKQAECLVLAVKPQILSMVCKSLKDVVQITKPLIISIAAGVRSSDIDLWLGGGLSVVRTMPNQPALLGLGVSGMYANEQTSKKELHIANCIIKTSGPVISVSNESDIDSVTAISGSGPAYFYLLIDMLATIAKDMGLDPKAALDLAIETARGASEIAKQSDETMDTLISHVRSPGGTTAAALDYLDNSNFRDIFTAAVTAARDRAKGLADQVHEEAKD